MNNPLPGIDPTGYVGCSDVNIKGDVSSMRAYIEARYISSISSAKPEHRVPLAICDIDATERGQPRHYFANGFELKH